MKCQESNSIQFNEIQNYKIDCNAWRKVFAVLHSLWLISFKNVKGIICENIISAWIFIIRIYYDFEIEVFFFFFRWTFYTHASINISKTNIRHGLSALTCSGMFYSIHQKARCEIKILRFRGSSTCCIKNFIRQMDIPLHNKWWRSLPTNCVCLSFFLFYLYIVHTHTKCILLRWYLRSIFKTVLR